MTPVQEYVAGLDEYIIHGIITSYEKFEKDGFIGEEPIRQHAELMIIQITGQANNDHITMWMHQLAFECYRYFYQQTYQ